MIFQFFRKNSNCRKETKNFWCSREGALGPNAEAFSIGLKDNKIATSQNEIPVNYCNGVIPWWVEGEDRDTTLNTLNKDTRIIGYLLLTLNKHCFTELLNLLVFLWTTGIKPKWRPHTGLVREWISTLAALQVSSIVTHSPRNLIFFAH